ncbi:hypothetical protein CU664_13040 [Pseudomonas syringae pv. actinidifoliorum]|nr:hypothetical protein [Pseudomonas syringae pv. actinidifoliorum]NAT64141.1 hypothetical protein [Pseudomonas syringae pv. actinidifoliorum]
MRNRLVVVIAIGLALGICLSLAVSYSICSTYHSGFQCSELQKFSNFYADKLRASLFTGFLTLGGFLMSLKTFIIVNMKKEVYDTQEYKIKWEIDNANKNTDRSLLYSPLQDLSHMLYATILFSICTSTAQLTIGLFENFWTSVICLWLAGFTTILLLWCLKTIKENLEIMFIHVEDKQQPKLEVNGQSLSAIKQEKNHSHQD